MDTAGWSPLVSSTSGLALVQDFALPLGTRFNNMFLSLKIDLEISSRTNNVG